MSYVRCGENGGGGGGYHIIPSKKIISISVDVNMDNLHPGVSMMIQIYVDLCSTASFIHHIIIDPLVLY